MQFETTQGELVTSESLDGRLVVLDFWATWCGPCVASMPHMKQLHQKYQDQGVQIIGISLDRNRKKLQQYVQSQQIPWPQHCDGTGWDNAVSREFGVRGIPSVYILSPDGVVLWSGNPGRLDKALANAHKRNPPRMDALGGMGEQDRDAAVQLLRDARQAIDDEDYSLMLEKLLELPDEATTDRRVKGNIRVLARKLKLQVTDSGALDDAIADNPEAGTKLTALLDQVAHKQIADATDRPEIPQVLPQVAAQKLEQADAARAAKKPFRAYKSYRWLVKRVPNSEPGAIAAKRIAEYESDDAFMSQLNETQIKEHARELLMLGKNYETAKRLDLAVKTYEQLVDTYPDAKQTSEARVALERIEHAS